MLSDHVNVIAVDVVPLLVFPQRNKKFIQFVNSDSSRVYICVITLWLHLS